MSDQIQSAAPAQPTSLTHAQAAQKYAEMMRPANPVSDAARTLGQQSAQARQARLAEAAAAQASPQGEGGDPANELTPSTPGTTDDAAPSTAAQPGDEAEPVEETPQTIDLGDGVSVTLDEVRDGFMLKADHTRKTQEIAEMRKGLEARESQKLAQLDNVLGVLQQRIGQPKSLSQWLNEDPVGGLERFAQQSDQIAEVQRGMAARQQLEAQRHSEALDLRDKQLADSYNKEWSDPAKRDAAFTKLTAYALDHGFSPDELKGLTMPHYIETLDKAAKYDELMAGKAGVAKILNGKPQVVRPGAKVSAQAAKATGLQQAEQRLKTSGSLADAVAVLRARRPG